MDDEISLQMEEPLEAEDLMAMADRIDSLAPDTAEWVRRLFDECLRARMNEALLMAAQSEGGGSDARAPGETTGEFDPQLAQVALDAAEWLKTLWDVGYMGAGSFPASPRSAFPLVELEDVLKSALFARIRQGKRPLPFPPPTRDGLPWHDLVEGEMMVHEVVAEIVRDERGAPIAAIIAGCADWQVVQEIVLNTDCLVQHRGKGPLFRLRFVGDEATLEREPPRCARTIRFQERGGFRSYILEWVCDGGDEITAVPLRAATWERAEAEAANWIAINHPELYGQVRFIHAE
ncbi:hypothetical protein [Propionivibrio soli]|uniref:hypothetical protein n=1 Tax=Propionivibrio soli TaxID=2976531 RepID=UPI0021E75AB3|nr:hypothetical protein [Propionivibrio soli]